MTSKIVVNTALVSLTVVIAVGVALLFIHVLTLFMLSSALKNQDEILRQLRLDERRVDRPMD